MALSFVKKGLNTGSVPSNAPQAADQKPAASATPASGGASPFLLTGKDAATAMAKEEAKAEAAKSGNVFEFYLKDGEEKVLTFLDGDLDGEGMLDVPMLYEHTVPVPGKHGAFETHYCTQNSHGWCPICDEPDYSRQALVTLLTVLDHTPYTVQKGPNAGKSFTVSKRLFKAKRQTVKQLTKYAAKHGGLAGCTFEVSRTGDKSPRVGNNFDFVSKEPDGEALMAKYGLTDASILDPVDYATEINFLPPEKLVALGYGTMPDGPGFEQAAANTADYKSQL